MLSVSRILVSCATLSISILAVLAAPTNTLRHANETEVLQSHIITIERLETLLRRASEIFRPAVATELQAAQTQPVPYQELQPPTAQPYNFYLPPFEHNEEEDYRRKLDEKSRNMEEFKPPPVNGNGDVTNYYAAKPKKLPKKFNAAEKLVNIKWLNAFEREALADVNGELPRAVYLNNEERNRINFDDSFFAVDMHVRTPNDNNPHKDTKPLSNSEGEQDYASNNEDEEDLVAAPAVHLIQISSQNSKSFKAT